MKQFINLISPPSHEQSQWHDDEKYFFTVAGAVLGWNHTDLAPTSRLSLIGKHLFEGAHMLTTRLHEVNKQLFCSTSC